MIAVDLFCGAGGLTRGLLNAGISVVLGVDVNGKYSKTYEKNNSPSRFLKCDITDLAAEEILDFIGKKRPLLLAGCAPCQPFSPHQKNETRSEDAKLVAEFGRLISALKPEWVFLENVPGIKKVRGFSTFRRFRKSLDEMKYMCCESSVDAKRYGVPQTRRRFVLIASKVASPSFPVPTHGPGTLPYRTVRDAIAHLPPLRAGTSSTKVANHRAAALTKINMRRMQNTPRDGGGRTDWRKSLWLKCHNDEVSHCDVYGRMRWDAPAPTLTCRCFSISNGRYGHPQQNRAITLREAACLQTFPDTFTFFGESQRLIGEQIGNAVPVQLAEAIGNHIVAMAARSAEADKARSSAEEEVTSSVRCAQHGRALV